jgi:hypothetical protein
VAAFVNPRSLRIALHPLTLPPFHGSVPLPQGERGSWQYETCAKKLLKGELKQQGITYAGLVEKLAMVGVTENGRNLNNKISRGGFRAAFFLQWLGAIGVSSLRLSD